VAHQENSSTEQYSTMALRYSRYRLTACFFRDPYEVFTRSVRDRDFARQGSRARQQGSFLLFPSLLYATLITSTLQFYGYLFCVSQAIEKPSHEFLSQKEYVKNMCAKCYKNQCHKQLIHMNIMDFPSAHRLRRKKMTAA